MNFHKETFDKTRSDALKETKGEVRVWIEQGAKVINLSRSVLDLAALTEDEEGKELLDHLFQKNDAILVIGAGNGKKIVSLSQYKTSDEKQEVAYSPYQISEKLKPYVNNIVYVGALRSNDKKSVTELPDLKNKIMSNLSNSNDVDLMVDLSDLAYVFKLANQSLVDFAIKIGELRFSKIRPKEKNQESKTLVSNIIKKTTNEFVKDYLNKLLEKAEEGDFSLTKDLFDILSDGSGENRPGFDSDKDFIFDETYSNLAGIQPNFICAPCANSNNDIGTSFSAPVITSALILGREKYPNLSAKDLLEKLYATADHVPGLEYWYGTGNMNLYKFLELPENVSEIGVIGDSEVII